MKKILISYPLSPKRMASLQSDFECTCVSSLENRQEETYNLIADFDALFAIGIQVDAALLDKGTKLGIVSNYAVGYDNIDIEHAKKKGIVVTNTPQSVTAPTADITLGLILSLCRRITELDRKLRHKQAPNWGDPKLMSSSLEDKTLGIIGMGRIGKAVAKRALAFGMQIIYHNRNPLPAEVEMNYNATYASLEDLLKTSDIVSVHAPLNAKTKHMISAKELALMQSSAFLINTARGAVIDEKALITALQKGQIAGAGLDVFEEEPHVPDAFLSLENVVLTPHSGTATKEARQAMLEEAFRQIILFLNGKEPESRVV